MSLRSPLKFGLGLGVVLALFAPWVDTSDASTTSVIVMGFLLGSAAMLIGLGIGGRDDR